MTGGDWVEIVKVAGTVAAAWFAFRATMNAKAARTEVQNVKADVEKVHTAVNSKMDALLKVTGESEYAKGAKEGSAKNAEKGQT